MRTLDEMEALGFEIRRDGPRSLVIIRRGAVAGWIEKSRREAGLWRAMTVKGELLHVRTVSSGIEHIVALTM